MSRLNHAFSVEYAELYGIEASIILTHIQFWIEQNQTMGRNQHDGRTWMYQTQDEIAACYPYMSKDIVFRAIKKLIESKILIKGNYNKTPFDKTSWYAFENEIKFTKSRNREMEICESQHQDRGIAEPIPYTKQDSKQEKQQQAAVVPLKKIPKEKIYECLKNAPVEEEFKTKITKQWKEDQVKNAIEWSTHRDNPPKKSYEASITYALQHGLSLKDIQPSKEESYELNKSYAMNYHGKKSRTATVECCNTFVEFVHNGVAGGAVISYTDKNFKKDFEHELERNGFKIEKEK